MEGQYNFQLDDESIDLTMFSDDRNSYPEARNPEVSVDDLRYVDPADLRFNGEVTDPDDNVKLASFSPKFSPMPPRKDEVTYAQINPTSSRNSSQDNDIVSDEEERNGPPEGGFVNEGFAPNEGLSPSPSTPPQQVPIYAQVNKPGKQTGENSEGAGDTPVGSSVPAPSVEEPTSVDQSMEQSSNYDENHLAGSEDTELGDRKDSFVDWPLPPPPSLMDPRFASDDLDLTPSKSRVASWADD